jgi:hypothetical protein
MTKEEVLMGLAGVLLPWGAYVEYRLGQIMTVTKTVENVEKKIDYLTEQLIDRGIDRGSQERRGQKG